MNHLKKPIAEKYIDINLGLQQLQLIEHGQVIDEYSISSALNGPGERIGSGRTPRGVHKIRIKIGHGCQQNTVFVARRPTGEIYSASMAKREPERDWILSRIIWLTGCQSGINRGGDVDTLRRYIYLHGCPDSEPMGKPLSHGCIRMRNQDIIHLFELVETGTPVIIRE